MVKKDKISLILLDSKAITIIEMIGGGKHHG